MWASFRSNLGESPTLGSVTWGEPSGADFKPSPVSELYQFKSGSQLELPCHFISISFLMGFPPFVGRVTLKKKKEPVDWIGLWLWSNGWWYFQMETAWCLLASQDSSNQPLAMPRVRGLTLTRSHAQLSVSPKHKLHKNCNWNPPPLGWKRKINWYLERLYTSSTLFFFGPFDCTLVLPSVSVSKWSQDQVALPEY